jgi:hypothetical protein
MDLGRVLDSQPTGTMMLVLGRSSAQHAALESYVMAASSPGTVPTPNGSLRRLKTAALAPALRTLLL